MLRAPLPVPSAAADASAADDDRAIDRAMAYLALYLPTYGTSVVMHVAMVMLLAFMVVASAEPSPVFDYTAAIAAAPPKVQVERRGERERRESRGRAEIAPTSLARQRTQNPVPDVATNYKDVLKAIGTGGGGREIGGFEWSGTRSGRIFMPPEGDTEAAKVVYVVDRSGSMTDWLDLVKMELKDSLAELDGAVEFHIIFYSSGVPVEMPTRRLVPATERNKALACDFIDTVIAHGDTDPSKALERAFAVRPEVIYLLTDGEFDRAIVDLVRRLNAGGKVAVHTIGFLYVKGPGEEVLRQIARENGGRYKYVSHADLAGLGG